MADEGPDADGATRGAGTDAETADTVPDGGETVTVQLPDRLGDWLDEQVADSPDRDRADVLRDLAAAYRELDTTDRQAVTDRLDAQREEYVDLVEDVRERVVALRREVDDLAPADRGPADHDHDHDLAAVAPDLPDRLERIETDLADLEARVDGGFENYETILRELNGTVEDLADRLDTLAAAVVDDDEPDAALARLKRAANQLGVREAACEDCGASLDVSLLTAPECPHCRSEFVDVADDGGLFGSHTLVVEAPPALDGDATPESGGDDQ